MLSSKATATVLVMKPSLNHSIQSYQQKLKYLMSFNYNIGGVNAEVIFDLIGDIIQKIEALKALKNVIDTAYSLLNEEQKAVIKEVFYRFNSDLKTKRKLNMTRYTFEKVFKSGFERMSNNIAILGFDDERLIANFDKEPLFIESAERAVARFYSKKNG